jgi:hypothetical protein
MNSIQHPYPFNERGSMEHIVNSKAYNMFKRLSKEEPLNRSEKNNLFHMLMSNSGKWNYMLMGMIIPFKQFLKRYHVKYNYGQIQEIWAFDKACIRNSFYTNSCITEIIEIK